MLSSKLVEVFLSLTGYERAALRQFLLSPYHNSREDVTLLFNYLQAQVQNLNNAQWQAEAAFAAVYPAEGYDKTQFRHLMSFLLRAIEEFFVVSQTLADQSMSNKLLLRAYRQRQLTQPLDYAQARAAEQLEKQPRRAPEYWQYRFDLEDTAHYLHQTMGREKIRSLQPLADYLNIQYFSHYLRLACLMHAQQAVSQIEYKLELLPAILALLVEQPAALNEAAVALYYYYYRAISESEAVQSRAYFTRFRGLLLEATQQLEIEDMRDLYYLAINYGIRRINAELGLLRETFDLYLLGIQHGFLLENGKLHRFAFKNIIALSLHLKEFDWAHQFIDSHGQLVHQEYQNTYIHYCRSKLLFTEKKYSQAIELLQQVEYEDIFLNIDAKIMLLKIYYELDETEVLASFLSSFRVFINRKKKLLNYHIDNYKNIIKAVSWLLQVNSYSGADVAKLRLKIEGMKILTERAWLLAQLERL